MADDQTAQVRSITSRDNPLLLRLRKLAAEPGAYRKFGQVWIEGEHLCEAYLRRGGAVPQAVISETGWQQSNLRRLARAAESVGLLPDALMAGLSTLDSPAPLAFAVPWPGAGTLRAGQPSVVLDRLQDAGNVGSILRSASAFGFTQVIALKTTAALWSPKVLRAGMGAHFGLQLVESVDAALLAELGVPLLATSSHAVDAIDRVELPWPCAWVLGHEGLGVSAALQQGCAMSLRIAQAGGEESLNVAAAAAVCLYESSRRHGR